jgi:uncharacterized protein
VKLAVAEPESVALRGYIRRRRNTVTSALARAEVARALLTLGPAAVQRGRDVLDRVEVIRLGDHILASAGGLLPGELRTLDAIHLATAGEIGVDLGRIVTYDRRMADAAKVMGFTVVAPQ